MVTYLDHGQRGALHDLSLICIIDLIRRTPFIFLSHFLHYFDEIYRYWSFALFELIISVYINPQTAPFHPSSPNYGRGVSSKWHRRWCVMLVVLEYRRFESRPRRRPWRVDFLTWGDKITWTIIRYLHEWLDGPPRSWIFLRNGDKILLIQIDVQDWRRWSCDGVREKKEKKARKEGKKEKKARKERRIRGWREGWDA